MLVWAKLYQSGRTNKSVSETYLACHVEGYAQNAENKGNSSVLPVSLLLVISDRVAFVAASSCDIFALQEIQERMPADPFEAELLMMAEAVAVAEKGSDDSSDESDTEGGACLVSVTATILLQLECVCVRVHVHVCAHACARGCVSLRTRAMCVRVCVFFLSSSIPVFTCTGSWRKERSSFVRDCACREGRQLPAAGRDAGRRVR